MEIKSKRSILAALACLAITNSVPLMVLSCKTPEPSAPEPVPAAAPQPVPNQTAAPSEAVSQPWSVEVTISRKEFTPGAVTVPPGSTVTWVNRSDEQHSVISSDKLFNVPVAIGGSFSYTFKQSGTYSYYCEVWSEMGGTVYVKP